MMVAVVAIKNSGSTELVDILQWADHFEPWLSWLRPPTRPPLDRSVLILSWIFSKPICLGERTTHWHWLFPKVCNSAMKPGAVFATVT
jgi:hypothetical protein